MTENAIIYFSIVYHHFMIIATQTVEVYSQASAQLIVTMLILCMVTVVYLVCRAALTKYRVYARSTMHAIHVYNRNNQSCIIHLVA